MNENELIPEVTFKEVTKVAEILGYKLPIGETNGNLMMTDIKAGQVIYEIDLRDEVFVKLIVKSKPRFSDTYKDWELVVLKFDDPEVEREIIVDEEFSALTPALYDFNPFPEFKEL